MFPNLKKKRNKQTNFSFEIKSIINLRNNKSAFENDNIIKRLDGNIQHYQSPLNSILKTKGW